MMNQGEKLGILVYLERELKDESMESNITEFGSRFGEISTRKNKVEFFNTKREKIKIKSKI